MMEEISWCANCGLQIIRTTPSNSWASNWTEEVDADGIRTEYYVYCPGSHQNLEKYPTFQSWNHASIDDDRVDHSHHPVDALVKLVADSLQD